MKTYVLTEADQATGCGQVHVQLTQDPYLCLHKVAGGSTEIIEYVAQPVTQQTLQHSHETAKILMASTK